MASSSVPSSRTSQTSSLFSACEASVFFAGDVRDDELLVMTLTRLWAPIIFILSFVGERAPGCSNLKAVSLFSMTAPAYNFTVKVVTFAEIKNVKCVNMGVGQRAFYYSEELGGISRGKRNWEM